MNTQKQKKATVRIGLPKRPTGKEVTKLSGPPTWKYEGSPEETQVIQDKKDTIRVDIGSKMNKKPPAPMAPATQRVPPDGVPQPPPQKKVPEAVTKLVNGETASPASPLQQSPPVAPPIAEALATGGTDVQQPPVGAPVVTLPPQVIGAPVIVPPPVVLTEQLESLKKEIEELKKQPHPTPNHAVPDQGEETSDGAPLPPDPQSKPPTQAILVRASETKIENREELAEDMATRIHKLNRKSQWVDFCLAFVSLLVSIALLIVLMRI